MKWLLFLILAMPANAQPFSLNDPVWMFAPPAPAASAAPTADLLWYKTDENASTNLTDSSVGGHNGTIRNSGQWRVGLNGSATSSITNNGTTGTGGDYIRSTAAIPFATEQITITFWARIVAFAASKMIIESSVNYNNINYGFACYPVDSAHVELAMNDAAADYFTDDFATPTTGADHFWVLQYDATTTTGTNYLWLDAVQKTPTSNPNHARNSTANFTTQIVFFSARSSGSTQTEALQGTYQDLRIYTGLLTSAQITAIFNAGPL